jgi:hypothetical protein
MRRIYTDAILIDNNSKVSGNSARVGGGIWSFMPDSTVIIRDSTISDNEAVLAGGIGISGSFRISNTRLLNNRASLDGGGIFNADATGTIDDLSLLSGNSARVGGGIFDLSFETASTLTISNSTLSANSANVYVAALLRASAL